MVISVTPALIWALPTVALVSISPLITAEGVAISLPAITSWSVVRELKVAEPLASIAADTLPSSARLIVKL